MFDIHFHLSYIQEKDDLLREARKRIQGLIVSALSLKEAEEVLVFKKEYPDFLFLTIGFHPENEDKFSENILSDYDHFIRKNKDKIVGLGEIGLDYFYEGKNRENMKMIFSRFLDLANEYNLPVLIHCRQAFDDLLSILKTKKPDRVILHCFSGSEGVLKESIRRGYFISFATNICYTQKHPRLAKITPLENLLLETDGPWLDPFSQGKILNNKPWNIIESAKIIAKIKEKEVNEILEIVSQNTKRAFNIPKEIFNF